MKRLSILTTFLLVYGILSAQTSAEQAMLQNQKDLGKMQVDVIKNSTPSVHKLPTAKLDTVLTICLVLTDEKTAASQTMWVTKVHGQVYDFKQPGQDQLKNDTLTLRKELIPVLKYYVSVNREVVDPKTKKKETKTQVQELPSSFVLQDYNLNIKVASNNGR